MLSDYDQRISNSEYWFEQSEQMYEAALEIFTSFNIIKPPFDNAKRCRKLGLMKASTLMLGLALENGLKGVVVFQTKPEIKNGKLNSNIFHNMPHDLRQIVEKINISISENEKDTLDRLTIFIVWAAKYAAPLHRDVYEHDKEKLRLKFTDFDVAKKLILQLKSIVNINTKKTIK